MEDFRSKLSGILAVGLVFGLTYLSILLTGSLLFPETSDVFEAALIPLTPDAGEGEACTLRPDQNHTKTGVVRVGPSNPVTFHGIDTGGLAPANRYSLFLATMADEARLHVCGEHRPIRVFLSGDTIPVSERQFVSSEIAFDLPPGGVDERYVLEIRQPAALSIQVNMMETGAFHARSMQTLLVRLFLVGGIITIICYNLVLGWLVGQWTYLFNALNTLSMLVLDFYLTGLGPAYLWPQQPWLSNALLALSEAGPGIFGILFVYHFLYPGDWRGLLSRPVFCIWPLANILFLASWIFLDYWQVAAGALAVWILGTAVIAIHLIRLAGEGVERARILLVPIMAVIVPSMIAGALQQFGGWDLGKLGEHHTEITLVFEALLLTLTLAYLLRVTERERQRERQARIEVAERSKQQLLRRVDQERSRIAAELHDSAGQGLVTIVSRLRRASHNDDAGPAKATLKAVERETRNLLDDIRRISHDLHPAALDHLGLTGALKELRTRLAKSSDFRIALDIDPALTLGKAAQLQVYRVIQELVSNSLRHSGGDSIEVQLGRKGDQVMVCVADNGTAKASENGDGIGLSVVSERAAILGGDVNIQRTGKGMVVRLSFPLAEEMRS